MNDMRLVWLDDHMKEPTKKARKNLLLTCGISLALIKGQLFPTNISALGLSIEQVQRETIFQALLFITIYYFVKFYIYCYIDSERQTYLTARSFFGDDIPKKYKEINKKFREQNKGKYEYIGSKILILSLFKIGIDFILPFIVGVYSLYVLANAF